MKRKLIAVLVCASALAMVLVLGACSNSSNQSSGSGDSKSNDSSGYTLINEGKLTVAASLDFPPFENLEGGKAVGFSIDLMDLLAEEMGLEAEYLPSVKFDTIVPMIASGGKADVGVSSITINDERLEQIDFTDSYEDVNQGIVAMKSSNFKSAKDLAGKKVGAQSGTTGLEWAEENIPGVEIVPFDEMTAVFAALQSGQIDGVAADLPVVSYYVKNSYQDAQVIEEVPTGEQYGIAVSKDNPELTEALNTALKAIKQNGKYAELEAKWFKIDN